MSVDRVALARRIGLINESLGALENSRKQEQQRIDILGLAIEGLESERLVLYAALQQVKDKSIVDLSEWRQVKEIYDVHMDVMKDKHTTRATARARAETVRKQIEVLERERQDLRHLLDRPAPVVILPVAGCRSQE